MFSKILSPMKESSLTLLVLEAQSPGLVGPGRPLDPVNTGQLAVLPTPDAKQVTHDIALLLAVQLGHVFIRAHFGSRESSEN